MNWQLLLLLLYSALLVGIGLWVGRQVKRSGIFFVAGRRLGPVLVFSTLLAANIGAGSTVGAAGLGYRDGLSAWWWVGSAGVGSIFLGLWVGPRMWEIASRHGLNTVGDFLELRYGALVRGMVASLLWLGTLAILAGQLIALAWVLRVVAGIPKAAGCLIGGLVVTLYFTAGGLLTSAWVNLVQLSVLILGFVIALPLALSSAGGLEGLGQGAGAAGEAYLNFWKGGDSGWTYLALLAPAFMVSPGLLQKIYGARSRRTVQLAVTTQGVALLVFGMIPPLLGMSARSLYPQLPAPELALPMIFMKELPAALGALGLAAIVSAELSSADAILFMLSTSLSQDLYRRFLRPRASDRQILGVARLAAVAGGTMGVVLALLFPSVISALTIFYSLLTVSLFVPVVAGLYAGRAGRLEAVTSIVAGVSLMLTCHVATAGQGWGGVRPVTAGLIAAVAGFVVAWAVKRNS